MIWKSCSVGIIRAPGIELTWLNHSAVRVCLEEPRMGEECITGYNVTAITADDVVSVTSASTEVILSGLDACRNTSITAHAYGTMLQGEAANITMPEFNSEEGKSGGNF